MKATYGDEETASTVIRQVAAAAYPYFDHVSSVTRIKKNSNTMIKTILNRIVPNTTERKIITMDNQMTSAAFSDELA